ncbi:hypothetical protein Q7P35_000271 [Cladosporium inversicolor]
MVRRYTFQCQLCYEDRREPRSQVRIIDGCEVCRTCLADDVAPRFAAALQSELDYPVKWDRTILDIDDFRAFVPAIVQEAWPARIREYETPVHNRVYCGHLTLGPIDRGGRRRLEICGNFLGSTTTSDQYQCPKCKTWSKDHHLHCPCTGDASNQQANAGQPTLDERTRGAEWQKCPNSACGVVIERSVGCNHFECAYCKASFCYICGDFATADSDHWLNICPRYGQPGDKDASFDEEYHFDSDEEEDQDWGNETYEGIGDFILDEEDDDAQESDLASEKWPGTWLFGVPFAIPGPNPSAQDQLQFDLNIATAFSDDLESQVSDRYDVIWNAPTLAQNMLDLISKMEINLRMALEDMIGDEPTTGAGRVEQAVDFFNFRIRHDQLRHGFIEAYNRGLCMAGYDRFFYKARSVRLFRAAFERYMILHAPRLLSNLAARDDREDLYKRFKYELSRKFDHQRHKGHDRTSEDELLLHTRRVDFEDTYVYA